jgi:hypothetical protein
MPVIDPPMERIQVSAREESDGEESDEEAVDIESTLLIGRATFEERF